MLLAEHPLGQGYLVIVREDGHAGLQHHRSPIELFGDEVHAGPVHRIAGGDGSGMGLHPLILG